MEYLILAFAAWRITSLFYIEDGPGAIFAQFRAWVGVYLDEKSQRQGKNELAKMVNCPACLSVWVAGAVALAYWILPALTLWLCLPLALSTGVIVIERIMTYGSS